MRSLPTQVRTIRPHTRTIGRAALAQARELGLMTAVAALAPLLRPAQEATRTVDVLAPVAVRPPSGRPVLLVHGFGGTKSGWFALTRALKAQGVIVHAMSYSSFGTSVEQLAEQLEAKVVSLRRETGADKVHLVGHSLGGVVIAQAFADGRLSGQVDTVVTIAAPFGGSPWARLLPLGAIVRALREGSPLLRRLAVAPAPEGVRWLAFTATLDIIVPGRRAVPPQAEAQTVSFDDVGHLGLLLSGQVVTASSPRFRLVNQPPRESNARVMVSVGLCRPRFVRLAIGWPRTGCPSEARRTEKSRWVASDVSTEWRTSSRSPA